MAVKQNEWISAEALHRELDRLIERYSSEVTEAVEALEAVRWWLMEEQVSGAEK